MALGEDVGDGAWSLRLQYRPLIRFIWLGALIMALGGVTTLFDRRYRWRPRARRSARCAGGRRAAVRAMKRYLLPLVAFALLVGRAGRRPQARTGEGQSSSRR